MISGLIECLIDGNPDVRHKAILAFAPRSDVAVPDLIERLNDEDHVVVIHVMYLLGDFGSLAGAAIPKVEGWLESPNQYLRLVAATTILKVDPSRTEFLPMIRDATKSDDLIVQSFARDFFDERSC